jgi:HlyD family secretion protein
MRGLAPGAACSGHRLRATPLSGSGNVQARPTRKLSTLGLAALLAMGCSAGDGSELGPTARVERASIERIIVATGTIEPEREVEVRPRIAGIIERIHVDDGDVVEKGQVLLEIERELLESQVRESEAAVQEAAVELRYAKIAQDRSQELEGRGAASQEARDEANSRYQRARAGVARARAGLETLSTQLSYATVRARSAGRVLQVHVEEGGAVSPVTAVTGGTILLTLAGTELLYLEGLVDENEVARVALDQEARVRTEAFGDRTFTGRVTDIAPMGKRIQNVTYFEIEIEIIDDDAQVLKPRMSADADIVAEVVKNALVVPETALRYRGEQIYVDTVVRSSSPKLAPKDVEVGIVDGSRVQVTSGLDEGDEVLLK